MPRAPVGALAGERLPGIGHNQGPPLEPGRSWRAHCWRTARRQLLPRLPLEVIRRRVTRARQLGLEYPEYASILLGSGRDVVAFLFTSGSVGLRSGPEPALPPRIAAKLNELQRCERLLMVAARSDLPALAQDVAGGRLPLDAIAAAPAAARASWAEGRAAIRAVLDPRRLAGDAVVMIGTRPEERAWADAACLASFLPADRYFRERTV